MRIGFRPGARGGDAVRVSLALRRNIVVVFVLGTGVVHATVVVVIVVVVVVVVVIVDVVPFVAFEGSVRRSREHRFAHFFELLALVGGAALRLRRGAEERVYLLVQIAKLGFHELLALLVNQHAFVVLLAVHRRHGGVVLLRVELGVQVRRRDGFGAGEAADGGNLRHLRANLLALQVLQTPNFRAEPLFLAQLTLVPREARVSSARFLLAHRAFDGSRVALNHAAVGLFEPEVVLLFETLSLFERARVLFRVPILGPRTVSRVRSIVLAVPAVREPRLAVLAAVLGVAPLLVQQEIPEKRLVFVLLALRAVGSEKRAELGFREGRRALLVVLLLGVPVRV